MLGGAWERAVFFHAKVMPMRRLAIGVIGLLALSTAAYGQVTEANAPAMMEQSAKKQQVWSPKENSPGVSMMLVEVRRDTPRIWYELHTTGFPPSHKYTIVQWPVNWQQPRDGMKGVTLEASGRAICAGTPGTCSGGKPNSPIHLQFSPFKTEPIRLELVAEDDPTLRAFVNFVPISNRVTDRNCSLESAMQAPLSALVAVQGAGFKPNADLKFLGDSDGERYEGPVKADADGNLLFVIGPVVKGKDRGVMRLSVTSPECAPTVSFRRGKDSYER
jgi:hypothetical protein